MTSIPGPIAREIQCRLTERFQPRHLLITDESSQHRGHGGYLEGVETHLAVEMAADALAPLSRLERQRAVNAVLADLMDNPIHALRLALSG